MCSYLVTKVPLRRDCLYPTTSHPFVTAASPVPDTHHDDPVCLRGILIAIARRDDTRAFFAFRACHHGQYIKASPSLGSLWCRGQHDRSRSNIPTLPYRSHPGSGDDASCTLDEPRSAKLESRRNVPVLLAIS